MVTMKKSSMRMKTSMLKKASCGRTSYMELDPSKRRPKEDDKERRIVAATLKRAVGGGKLKERPIKKHKEKEIQEATLKRAVGAVAKLKSVVGGAAKMQKKRPPKPVPNPNANSKYNSLKLRSISGGRSAGKNPYKKIRPEKYTPDFGTRSGKGDGDLEKLWR